MKITDKLNRKRPGVSFEIFPPKRGTSLNDIDETLDILCSLNPDFISVTFGAGGSVSDNKTVELACKIKDRGITPLVHLTCLNYGKKEILYVLECLKEKRIENILALRGDRNPNFEPKHEFIYASDLITFIKNNGDFGISGACYPEGHPESFDEVDDFRYLREKVEAGASHLISQLFFDNQIFYSFAQKARIAGINVPIEAGIMPVINKAQIERMVTLCGASLPEKFRKILDKYADKPEALYDAGMTYAVNQIVDLLANNVDGVHIYTMNNPKVASRICGDIKYLI